MIGVHYGLLVDLLLGLGVLLVFSAFDLTGISRRFGICRVYFC